MSTGFRPTTGGVSPINEHMYLHLGLMPTGQVRVLVARAFKMLDSPNPPYGARNQYEALVEELEERERDAARRGGDPLTRTSFRDNFLYQRFELRLDGALAAHMRYRLRAGRIALIDGVEQPAFRDQGVDAILLRHVLFNTHRRRLSVVPQCSMAFAFLADNPQYQTLAETDTTPSAHLHS